MNRGCNLRVSNRRSSRIFRYQHDARSMVASCVVLVSALLSAGCMVGPSYHRPAAPLAAAWQNPGAEGMRTDAMPAADWWRVFRDPTLDDLVARAYRQNLTLQAAGLRVVEAQALRGV